jgi:hypothetical protein
MTDRWYMLLDTVKWFFRRLTCRVVGHVWEAEYEDAGDCTYMVREMCRRCFKRGD